MQKRQLLLTDDEANALYDHLVRRQQDLQAQGRRAQQSIDSGAYLPFAVAEFEEQVREASEAAESAGFLSDRLMHTRTYVEVPDTSGGDPYEACRCNPDAPDHEVRCIRRAPASRH